MSTTNGAARTGERGTAIVSRPPVTLPCPWCDARMAVDAPLAAAVRCGACQTAFEVADDHPMAGAIVRHAA